MKESFSNIKLDIDTHIRRIKEMLGSLNNEICMDDCLHRCREIKGLFPLLRRFEKKFIRGELKIIWEIIRIGNYSNSTFAREIKNLSENKLEIILKRTLLVVSLSAIIFSLFILHLNLLYIISISVLLIVFYFILIIRKKSQPLIKNPNNSPYKTQKDFKKEVIITNNKMIPEIIEDLIQYIQKEHELLPHYIKDEYFLNYEQDFEYASREYKKEISGIKEGKVDFLEQKFNKLKPISLEEIVKDFIKEVENNYYEIINDLESSIRKNYMHKRSSVKNVVSKNVEFYFKKFYTKEEIDIKKSYSELNYQYAELGKLAEIVKNNFNKEFFNYIPGHDRLRDLIFPSKIKNYIENLNKMDSVFTSYEISSKQFIIEIKEYLVKVSNKLIFDILKKEKESLHNLLLESVDEFIRLDNLYFDLRESKFTISHIQSEKTL